MPKSCLNLQTHWNREWIRRRLFPHLGKWKVRKNSCTAALYCKMAAAGTGDITRDIKHTWKKQIETPPNRYIHTQFDSVWKRLHKATLDAKHNLIARFINKNCSKDQIPPNIVVPLRFTEQARLSNQVLPSYLRWFTKSRHEFSSQLYSSQ